MSIMIYARRCATAERAEQYVAACVRHIRPFTMRAGQLVPLAVRQGKTAIVDRAGVCDELAGVVDDMTAEHIDSAFIGAGWQLAEAED